MNTSDLRLRKILRNHPRLEEILLTIENENLNIEDLYFNQIEKLLELGFRRGDLMRLKEDLSINNTENFEEWLRTYVVVNMPIEKQNSLLQTLMVKEGILTKDELYKFSESELQNLGFRLGDLSRIKQAKHYANLIKNYDYRSVYIEDLINAYERKYTNNNFEEIPKNNNFAGINIVGIQTSGGTSTVGTFQVSNNGVPMKPIEHNGGSLNIQNYVTK